MRTRTTATRTLLGSVALAALSLLSSAQIVGTETLDDPEAYQDPLGYEDPLAYPGGGFPFDRREIELGLSDTYGWFAYREPYEQGDSYLTFELLGDEIDNYAARAMLTRLSPPIGNPQLGLGLGVYGAHFDVPGDDFIAGIPISLGARYEIPFDLPITASTAIAWAPDITTFEGGDQILDIEARVEFEFSDSAAFFVGYRRLEVEIGDLDPEIGDELAAGIRMRL